MTITLDRWAASIDGTYLDMDGYGNPVWQCHDVWLSYLINVAGGTQYMGYAPSDFTDSVWTHFPVNGVDQVMTRHTGTAGIQKGDVIFWRFGSPVYPFSHVAVALGPASNGSVVCLTQNPGPTHRERLTLDGALGYLRPKNAPTPPPIEEPKTRKVKTMLGLTIADGAGRYGVKGKKYYATYDGYSHVSLTQEDANSVSVHLGEPFANVSYSAWEAYRDAARDVR